MGDSDRKPVLYTCHLEKKGASWHPCGIATKALDEAGLDYEIRHVRGYASMPWTWPTRRRDRTVVRELSGQNGVPVLVLADGEVIAGSAEIKAWSRQAPEARRAQPRHASSGTPSG